MPVEPDLPPRTLGDADFVIVGGGFYGCCLALFLRSISRRIILLEAGAHLLDRASRVNQARIHTGFHYPRSPLTAVKSMVLHERFASDFSNAVVDDFQMLYAIAHRRSRISAHRFVRMFTEMGAPLAPANNLQAELFNPSTIEAVFACQERAFDYTVLRDFLTERMREVGIDVRVGVRVDALTEKPDHAIVQLASGEELVTSQAFNVTYAQLNNVMRSSRHERVQLKYELSEIALIKPPPLLKGYGVTIMDGPFLSTMPYPAESLYSLTHVRYTPHASWTDESTTLSPYEILARSNPQSRHRQMLLDGQRYMPSLITAEWQRSLYEVKTVLVKNERDDGRPIVYHRSSATSRIASILGGKIDNIYDLFDLVRTTQMGCSAAHDGFVYPRTNSAAGISNG